MVLFSFIGWCFKYYKQNLTEESFRKVSEIEEFPKPLNKEIQINTIMKYADELVEILISLVVLGALFPIINSTITAIGLDNISVAGTYRDFSFIGYLIVLGILFGAMRLGVQQMKTK